MHPSKDILEKFIHRLLRDENLDKEIRRHLTECEFCREYCENYGEFIESIDRASRDSIPQEAANQSEDLLEYAPAGRIIPLWPFLSQSGNSMTYLAADGADREKPRIQNLATLYSEDPEIILRLMRDLDMKEDYLQIVSDDPVLAANVMIQLPDIDRNFITDLTGRALVENLPTADLEEMKWQIKLPDAVFSLEPFEYDPERVESSAETILETAGGDRLKIVFEELSAGKQISLQLLELNGSADFGAARVIVSSESVSVTKDIMPDHMVPLGTFDLHEKINIRFFV